MDRIRYSGLDVAQNYFEFYSRGTETLHLDVEPPDERSLTSEALDVPSKTNGGSLPFRPAKLNLGGDLISQLECHGYFLAVLEIRQLKLLFVRQFRLLIGL